MFIPIIGWGQDVTLVKLISSEKNTIYYEDCSAAKSTIKLVFQEYDMFDDELKPIGELVLYYTITEDPIIKVFNWDYLEECLFYIEYKYTYFIGIVY